MYGIDSSYCLVSRRVVHPFHRLFDVSKQVAGQMFVHGVNILISDLVAHHAAGNACVLYFLNILVDTTLGPSLFALHPKHTVC